MSTEEQWDMNFLAHVREDIADGTDGKVYSAEFVADIMASVDRVIAGRDQARREFNDLNRLNDEGDRICAEAIAGLERAVNFAKQLNAMIDTLTAERDEARRHACEQRRILPAPWAMEPKDFAFTMGWDLYDKKEDGK